MRKQALQTKLYNSINLYGLTDDRTVALSQELDEIIVKEQRERMENCDKKRCY